MAAPTYPLNHPSTPAFTNSSWRLVRSNGISESPFTGKQQVYEYDYALWEAEISLPPMLRSQAAAWCAFFMKLHGQRGTFLLGDPDAESAQGTITGSNTLSANASVGDFTLTISSGQNSITGIFKAGDYVQLGTAATSKLYMVVDDADSNSSGIVSVQIEPKVKTAVSSGGSVVVANPRALMRMSGDELGWSTDQVSKYGITFACKEAF